MQLPKVRTFLWYHIWKTCSCVPLSHGIVECGAAFGAMAQGQMDPMQTNMPFDDDAFRQFEDGLFDDDDE
jgi:hypothetical protein